LKRNKAASPDAAQPGGDLVGELGAFAFQPERLSLRDAGRQPLVKVLQLGFESTAGISNPSTSRFSPCSVMPAPMSFGLPSNAFVDPDFHLRLYVLGTLKHNGGKS